MSIYEKILIAVDGSEYSLNAVKKGFEFANQLGAAVGLIYVIDTAKAISNPDLGVDSGQMITVLKKQAEETLDQYIYEFGQGEVVKFMPEGTSLFREIIKLAQVWEANLIIMGTHGRTGLEHLLMGSIAEHVMRHSTIPVMIIPTKFEKK